MILKGGKVLEQQPMHEDVSAADSLEEDELRGMVEKPRVVERSVSRAPEAEPEDHVLENVRPAEPKAGHNPGGDPQTQGELHFKNPKSPIYVVICPRE